MALTVIENALQKYSDSGRTVRRKLADDPGAIAAVAEALELMLPEDFREFYAIYDCIAYGPEELLAVDEINDHHGLLDAAKRPVPGYFLPFIADGAGGYYAIACQERGHAETSEFGAVFFIPGYPPFDLEFKAADFTQFLLSRLQFWADRR